MKTAADRFAFLEYQGPDNTRATKLNVSVFDMEALLILRTWQVAEGDIRQDPQVMAEVSQHLAELQVSSKSTLEGIKGCPHEAGEDYPLGRNCPHCPYWANRDVTTGRLIEPKPPVMSLAKVLEELSNVRDEQPLDAIDSADAWRKPLTESLLAAMDHCLIQPALISNGQAIQGAFACYLLAKWREPRAFPRILGWLHLPDVDSWGITREIRDEDGDRLLASVYDGDFEALREAILNPEARAEARVVVLGAVGTLGLWGEVPLEQVDAFLLWLAREGLERKPGLVWDELTKQCLSLGAVAVYDEVRRAVAEGLVTPVESLPELLETIEKTPRAKLLKLGRSQKPPITDVAEETSWWDCWNLEETPPDDFYEMDPGEPAIPMVREVPKVGRNDPCPCGSGKKHKKCCGN